MRRDNDDEGRTNVIYGFFSLLLLFSLILRCHKTETRVFCEPGFVHVQPRAKKNMLSTFL